MANNGISLCIKCLFSFDEFSSEIASGRLSWSPVHTNQKFWRDNCHRFVEKEYKMLKNIIHILETTHDSEVRNLSITRWSKVRELFGWALSLDSLCWMSWYWWICSSLSPWQTSTRQNCSETNCHAVDDQWCKFLFVDVCAIIIALLYLKYFQGPDSKIQCVGSCSKDDGE